MKMAIALTLFMVTTNTFATDIDPNDCQTCQITMQSAQQPLSSTDQQLAANLTKAVMSSVEKEAFDLFRRKLCDSIDAGGDNTSLNEKVEEVFQMYNDKLSKLEPTDPQEKIKTRLMFLNDHKNEIICSSSIKCQRDGSLCKDGMQYMKYALYTGLYKPLLEGVLTGSLVPDDGKVLIDFNAITYNEDGKPETLLDYIKRELEAEKAKPNKDNSYISSIESFRDMISDPDPDNGFGAVYFDDLPQSVKAKYPDNSLVARN